MFSGRGMERHKDGPEWSPPAGWEPELGGVKELAVEEDEDAVVLTPRPRKKKKAPQGTAQRPLARAASAPPQVGRAGHASPGGGRKPAGQGRRGRVPQGMIGVEAARQEFVGELFRMPQGGGEEDDSPELPQTGVARTIWRVVDAGLVPARKRNAPARPPGYPKPGKVVLYYGSDETAND